MKRITVFFVILSISIFFSCGKKKQPSKSTKINKNQLKLTNKPKPKPKKTEKKVEVEIENFLKKYNDELAKIEIKMNKAYWIAANSGKKEDFELYAKYRLELKTFHSNKKKYKQIEQYLKNSKNLQPLTLRSLKVAHLAFKENQLPKDLLKQLVNKSKEIEMLYTNFRAEIGGKKYTNNKLLEMLSKEKNSAKREKIWKALKAVGEAVGPKLVELAKIRNKAAKTLGYKDYWYMQIDLQEYDANKLLQVFENLEKSTNQSFKKMKSEMDKEIATKLHKKPEELMPWDYDNPFFQEPPASPKLDMNKFYKGKKKEDIVEIARKFFADINLPIEDIIKNSDYYERKGKDQHAFCMTIDRAGDIHTLLNIKPTSSWMETMLHESGHAIYYKYIDRKLSYNLREAGHIFMTEGIAMMFGALGKNIPFLLKYVKVDPKQLKPLEKEIFKQRKREQLMFARWTMVMLHFEKDLYNNPNQDLNKLWYNYVVKYQMLNRPKERNKPDWASKPHFTIAPVYYHNYMYGELYAAQLRHSIAKLIGFKGTNYNTMDFSGQSAIGKFLIQKVFKTGMSEHWSKLVKFSTGEELNPAYFAAEVK